MKRKLAYRLTISDCRSLYDYTYALVYIEVKIGSELDAAKEYDHDPDEYHLERLRQIRSEGQSTKYFSASDSQGFTVRCQADRESWNRNGTWYACNVSEAKFDADTCKLLAKLATSLDGGFYTSPAKVLAALRELGARPVKYARDTYSAWIYQDTTAEEELALLAASPFEEQTVIAAE